MSAVLASSPRDDANRQGSGKTEDEVRRWSAWDRFVAVAPDAGFMQASPWSLFRARTGGAHFAVTLKDGDAIVGGAVVGKWTYEPGRCFYYVQEGPVLPPDQAMAAEVFEAVLESVERHRQAENETVSHLRIEPRWQAVPDFVRGFRPPPFSDRFREPRETLCINLLASEVEILAQMKPKGRYNIGVARRHGVVVVRDNSYQGSIDFMRIQRCTAVRKGIRPMPPGYFRAMLSELLPRGQASLYFAEYRGRRLATALVVTFGRRATYFYGGSLALHRRVMAPYLLHYEIMGRAKAAGCEWYDLWGVAPPGLANDAWQQISEFKRKFGGVEVQLVPPLDCVYDAAAYERFPFAMPGAPKLATALASRSAKGRRGVEQLPTTERLTADSAEVRKAMCTLADVRLFEAAVPRAQFTALRRTVPQSHFQRLVRERFGFYQTTFWYPLDRNPENAFESIVNSLRPMAQPTPAVIGVEWWFSVLMPNSTPQWLLPCHFDRNDLDEIDLQTIKHPELATVLFLNSMPYGELVITDQVLSENGAQPHEPGEMRFITPKANRYAVFPGHLRHGVIGRMWRPLREPTLRITMAVNWWSEKPKAAYIRDSRECMTALRLRA